MWNKKAHLKCCEDIEEKRVACLIISWAGPWIDNRTWLHEEVTGVFEKEDGYG